MDRRKLSITTSVEAITATLEALRVGEEMPMTNEALAAYRERIAAVLAEQLGEWEQVGWQMCSHGAHPGRLYRVDGDGHESRCPDCVPVFLRAGRYGESDRRST